jgi:hypothetical protein
MHAPSVGSPEIRYELALPRPRTWWGVLEGRRRSRGDRGRQPPATCFGRLTGKDAMVIKGLAASLATQVQLEDDRW